MNRPWPFRNREPEPEPEPDIYLDLRTGYHSRRFEEAEKNRIAALERRLKLEQEAREAGDMTKFQHGGPNVDAANLRGE